MKALSVFRTRIAPRVPGASDDLIDQAVLDACIDFSTRSLVVKRMMDPFLTKAGVLEYELDAGVVQVVRAWCNGRELQPLHEDEPDATAFRASVTGVVRTFGTPRCFVQTDPGVIGLSPTPDSVYSIDLRVALKPLRAATQVEDQLFEDWCPAIVDGALARLYEMGDFANAGLFKAHTGRYEMALNTAMLEARMGAARAQTRVRPVHI